MQSKPSEGTPADSPNTGSPAAETPVAPAQLRARLLGYCGSETWVGAMARDWPYRDTEELLAASEHAFDALSREDWLEAFAAHARIGAPKDGDPRGAAEQAGVATAAAAELAELARLNAAYEQRFGHVFLICATGLGAGEMLAALRERIVNPAATEFDNAGREQRKITALRLRSALSSSETPSGAITT